MGAELAGANGRRSAEGTVPLRQPSTTSNYQIYLCVLALFGQEHTTFVLARFIYLDSLYFVLLFTYALLLAYREFPWMQCWHELMAGGRVKGLFLSDYLTQPLTASCIYLYCLYLGRRPLPLYCLD